MPIRENRISDEELEQINSLRRTLEENSLEENEVVYNTSITNSTLIPQEGRTIFTVTDGTVTIQDEESVGEQPMRNTERIWKKSEYDNSLEKKCTFIEIQPTEILECNEPHYINGTHLKWKVLKVDFKKECTPKLIEYKDLKDFDYVIDVYDNKEYLYRWVISCESIYEIDFSNSEFVRVIINPKDCNIVR